ncbi:MAG: YggT family protein [Cocleimonas sp.]|nr:YggT family protein [Cocleimonas sp.]
MNVLQQIGAFLIETLFSLYIGAVVLRMLLGYARANFYNPLSQFLVKVTNPVLVPMRRFIPSVGKIDTSAIVLALGLTMIKMALLSLIVFGTIPFLVVILGSIIDLAKVIIWIYLIALLVQAVMSWVGSAHGNPVAPLVQSLTEPLLRPVRKVIPAMGALDLSPLVVIILLNILLIIINNIGA